MMFPRVTIQFGKKADPDKPPTQRFIAAAGIGDLEGMRKAAKAGAYKIGHNLDGDNALTLAARNGQIGAMHACVYEFEIPVDLPGTHRDTALCVALDNAQPEAAVQALRLGANPYPQTIEGIRTRSAFPKLSKAIKAENAYEVVKGFGKKSGHYEQLILNQRWSPIFKEMMLAAFSPDQFTSAQELKERLDSLPKLLPRLSTADGLVTAAMCLVEARRFLQDRERFLALSNQAKDPEPHA